MKVFIISAAISAALTASPAYAADFSLQATLLPAIFFLFGVAGLWFAAFCDHTHLISRSTPLRTVHRKLRLIEPYTDH